MLKLVGCTALPFKHSFPADQCNTIFPQYNSLKIPTAHNCKCSLQVVLEENPRDDEFQIHLISNSLQSLSRHSSPAKFTTMLTPCSRTWNTQTGSPAPPEAEIHYPFTNSYSSSVWLSLTALQQTEANEGQPEYTIKQLTAAPSPHCFNFHLAEQVAS